MKKSLFICVLGLAVNAFAMPPATQLQAKTAPAPTQVMDTSTYVLISTSLGDIKIRLYDETPQHKANFIKIIRDGVLDSTLFHRVIPEFMIQGGDPNSKNAVPGQRLGMGGLDYRVPAEFNPALFHKRGALAAARDGNPQKASSSTQFYIVQGRKYTEEELNTMTQRSGIVWAPEQREVYKTVGGAPFLDQGYTVFGEVVEGMGVIDAICTLSRDPNDRPYQDIRMQVEVIEKK